MHVRNEVDMKNWKKCIAIGLACSLLTGSTAVWAGEQAETENIDNETEVTADDENGQEINLEGQLTLDDISAMNGGAEKVYSHNDHVTFVDGTCTDHPVAGFDDAAGVVNSMMTLIGADANTEFIPWRMVTDPMGNNYYIFQQMYRNTTVCGGAVKVITDMEGMMIGLTSSVEARMPEVEEGEGITAEEAEEIVNEKERAATGRNPEILSQFTDRVILPAMLKFDIESEDESNRFAYVVYTDNLSGDVIHGTDLPYLAHYVSMTGEYLYQMPAIIPDDDAGRSGYDSGYVFQFMEPAEYTGYVDLSDGSEKEITVTVMRDTRTGMYYLGNIERRIVVGQCYDFLYNEGQIVLEYSPDNKEWDQVGLLSLYNYCRAWDYYKEIGWSGADGDDTPIIILNNFCDDHRVEVNNACYVGQVYGMQVFLASKINDLSQCLDVIAHEFTHCVTRSLMTYNSYMNDYGAINEALSDLQGKNCEMMAGDVDRTNWVMGANSNTPVRSMSDPHLYTQPEYSWDLYYHETVETPTAANDHGGVHSNSSLLNRIGYFLVQEGGMTLEEARVFWFMTDCTMVPGTDYLQLAELLPWVLKNAGMDQYADQLNQAIENTRLNTREMPQSLDEDRALVTMTLPDTEAFDTDNWILSLTSIRLDDIVENYRSILSSLLSSDFSILPESVRQAVEAAKEERQNRKSEEERKGFFEGLIEAVAEAAELTELSPERLLEKEKSEEVFQDFMQWFLKGIRDNVFSSYGNAGLDGSTLHMVVRPGRCIPILQHIVLKEGSQVPDQVAFAVYMNGKWYGAGVEDFAAPGKNADAKEENEALSEEIRELTSDLMNVILKNLGNIHSLDDVLDLVTVDIKGGEILEISANGLDEIVIPAPTAFEERAFGTIEPGKKSRPKMETETEAESDARLQG